MNHLPNKQDPDPNPHPNPDLNSTQPTTPLPSSNKNLPQTQSTSTPYPPRIPVSSIISPNNHSTVQQIMNLSHHPSSPSSRNRVTPITREQLQSDQPSPSKMPRISSSHTSSTSNSSLEFPSSLPSSSNTRKPLRPARISSALFVPDRQKINASHLLSSLSKIESHNPRNLTTKSIHQNNKDQDAAAQKSVQRNTSNNAMDSQSFLSNHPSIPHPPPYHSDLERIRTTHLYREQRYRFQRLNQLIAQNVENMERRSLQILNTITMKKNMRPEMVCTVPPNPEWPSCEICYEQAPPNIMLDTGACTHRFCSDCMKQYLRTVLRTGTPYPVTCPSCHEIMKEDKINSMLQTDLKLKEGFNAMMIKKFHIKQMRYCSNPKCAIPFDWDCSETDENKLEEYHVRVACPCCYHETCAKCRVEWHKDLTCRQWRKQEKTVKLYESHGRMQCPDCGHLIERKSGCNHVVCICGCNFCHKCGSKYNSRKRVPGNEYRRASCDCNYTYPPIVGRLRCNRRVERRRAREIHEQVETLNNAGARNNAVAQYDEPNGHVNLRPWLFNHRLPAGMERDIRELRCPYDGCVEVFGDIAALERHIATVRTHHVYICCGRPFLNPVQYVQHVIDQSTED